MGTGAQAAIGVVVTILVVVAAVFLIRYVMRRYSECCGLDEFFRMSSFSLRRIIPATNATARQLKQCTPWFKKPDSFQITSTNTDQYPQFWV